MGTAKYLVDGERSHEYYHTSVRIRKKFRGGPPKPPLSLKIEVFLIAEFYAEFGCTLNDSASCQAYRISATADTGVQTYSSGPEILKVLRCTDDRLLPTSRSICGITNDQLNIRGIFFMRIRVGPRKMRRVVYISDNTSWFYLSESALKDLGLIHQKFAKPDIWDQRCTHQFRRRKRNRTATKMSLLELLNRGTPMTWCSRLVVAP